MLLTVIHRRLPDRSTLLNVSAGWHAHLDILVARADRRGAGVVLGRLEPSEDANTTGAIPADRELIVLTQQASQHTEVHSSTIKSFRAMTG